LVSSAQKDFADANFHVSELLVKRLVCSLVAKPFLILAGLSGSGKTQLAIAIARWLSSNELQRQVVAVGADWTSNQNLVGYPDALNETQYVSTPTLDLILRALKFPTLPFFLILDEMNLSHVERYFSDLLSSIESGENIHLYRAEAKRGGIDQSIEMPRNLFILGTVNVDETTYMFSPKVLDRANVIEFEVDKAAIASFLASPNAIDFSAIDGKGARFAKALVEDATTDLQVLSSDEKGRCEAELLLLFELFEREGFPFAFRTAKEVVRFIEVFRRMSPEDWSITEALDSQVLQRLMPKFHGDRGRLKRILMSLGVASAAQHVWQDQALNSQALLNAASNIASSMGDEIPKEWLELLHATPPSAQMPLTLNKAIRMLNRLRRDGFTTFIEA
jgi:5-methylcytosine-specific restriction endonuclease McrBC GTP-binding regulatory subunit McrB